MDVLFIRHASAEAAGAAGDPARRLTQKGRSESRLTARALAAMGAQPQALLTSPLHRAQETAEIIASTLGAPDPVAADCLAPPGDASALCGRLIQLNAAGVDAVAVIGHAPSLDEFIARLTANTNDVGTSLSKAGAACVALPAPDSGQPPQLRWLMHREQLAMIGGAS